MSTPISKLSSSLFLDINPEEIDDEFNKRFIIQRVLERGSSNSPGSYANAFIGAKGSFLHCLYG